MWLWASSCSLCQAGGVYDGSSSGLVAVPTDIPDDVWTISLHSNSIVDIVVDPFTNLTEIKILRLSSNVFTVMPVINSTAVTLEELYLMENAITEIVPGYFQDFHSLNTLNLFNNRIIRLDSDVFSGLHSIYYLNLLRNDLEFTDDNAFRDSGIGTLSILLLGNNNLRDFPCVGLHSEAYESRSLFIGIPLNQIQTIRAECVIGLNMTANVKLKLGSNQLTSIKNISYAMPTIQHIYAENNPNLSDFPWVSPDLISGSQFKILDLSGNTYPHFPLIHMRHTLEEVYLSTTAMDCAPPTRVSGLANLETLELHGNNLQLFPDPTCADMLEDTAMIEQYGIDSEVYFPLLRILLLDDNNLNQFPDLALAPKLESLGLSSNRIREVTWQLMMPATSLQTLNIQDNWIMSFLHDVPIAVNLAAAFPSLQVIIYRLHRVFF